MKDNNQNNPGPLSPAEWLEENKYPANYLFNRQAAEKVMAEYAAHVAKYTARNVRHRAAEIALEVCAAFDESQLYNLPGSLPSTIHDNIMRIRFQDIYPPTKAETP